MIENKAITIQPANLHMINDISQLRIQNQSNKKLEGCTFILYNHQKYQFMPKKFTLYAHQEIIINVSKKINDQISEDSSFDSIEDNRSRQQINYRKTDYVYLQYCYNSHQYKQRIIIYNQNHKIPESYIPHKHKISINKNQLDKTQQKFNKSTLIKNIKKQEHTKQQSRQQKLVRMHLKQVKQLKYQLLALTKDKQQLYKKNILLANQLSQLQDNHASNQQVAPSRQKQLEFLEIQNQELKGQLYNKHLQIQELHQYYLQFLQSKEIDIQKLTQSYSSKLQKIQQLQSCSKELKETNQQLSTKLKALQQNQQAQKRKQNKLAEPEALNKALEKQNLQFKLNHDSIKKQYDELKSQLKAESQAHNDSQKQLYEIKAKLQQQERFRKNNNDLQQKMRQQLQSENDRLKNKIQELKEEKNMKEDKTNKMQDKISSLEEQLSKKDNKLEQLRDNSLNNENQLQSKLRNLEKDNSILRDKIKQMENLIPQLQDYQNNLANLEGVNKSLEEQMAQIKNQNKQKGQQNKQIASMADQLEKQLKQQKRLMDNLKKLDNFSRLKGNTEDTRRAKSQWKQFEKNVTDLRCARSQYPHKKIKNQFQNGQLRSDKQIDHDISQLKNQADEYKEFKKRIGQKMRDVGDKINIKFVGFKDHIKGDQNRNNNIYDALNFFNNLEKKLSEQLCDKSRLQGAEKKIQFLKGQIRQLQKLKQLLKKDKEEDKGPKLTGQQINVIEFMRQEMKAQYKKLYQALKMSEEKFQILKKKIYQEYRVKIVQLISKKQKNVSQIENILQRFVQGLGNVSHKQAIMAKQVHLKNQARKEAQILKQKLQKMDKKMQNMIEKQNYTINNQATKDLKLSRIQNEKNWRMQREAEWLQLVKQEALAVTHQSQNNRLKQQLSIIKQKYNHYESQLKNTQSDLKQRQQQLIDLKKKMIKIQLQRQQNIKKNEDELSELKKKYVETKQNMITQQQLRKKQKQVQALRNEILRKNEIIINYKNTTKKLEHQIQAIEFKEKQQRNKQQTSKKDYIRLQNNNKQLRSSNNKYKEANKNYEKEIESLRSDNKKKNLQIKNLRQEIQDYKMKVEMIKSEKNQFTYCQGNGIKNQNQLLEIKFKGCESLLNTIISLLQSVYSRLIVIAAKKSEKTVQISQKISEFQSFIENSKKNFGKTDSFKLNQAIEEIIEIIETRN